MPQVCGYLRFLILLVWNNSRDHEAYAIVDSMDDVRRWALEQTAA